VEQSPEAQVVTLTSATPTIPPTDRERAEQTIANTELVIDNVDKEIAWFRSNRSTSDDSEVQVIIVKREIAAAHLSTARDAFAGEDYVQAHLQAQDAFDKANETYYQALYRQQHLIIPSGCGYPPPTFDQVVLALGLGIIPALLTAILFSLTNTVPLPLVNRIAKSVYRNSVYAVFIIAWIFFAITPILGGFVREHSHLLALVISGIWVFLILVLVSMVLITISWGILQTIRFLMKRGVLQKTGSDDYQMIRMERIRNAIQILLLVLLTLFMPMVFLMGVTISAAPFLCM